jgi:hypothetical protein
VFGSHRPNDYYNPSGVPSGYLVSSAEDMSHFLIAELNGGRYQGSRVLSGPGIAATQEPAVATGDGFSYGTGWQIGRVGGVPAVYHPGAVYNFETLAFIEPGTDRGAVVLINDQGLLGIDAFTSLQNGVARMLAGQDPQASSLTVPELYLIADTVLIVLSVLVVVPLARLPQWSRRRTERRHWAGRACTRAAVEVIVPVILVAGTWWGFRQLGARNWYEVVSLVPDFVPWLLVMCGLLLLTGILRGILAVRVARTAERPAAGGAARSRSSSTTVARGCGDGQPGTGPEHPLEEQAWRADPRLHRSAVRTPSRRCVPPRTAGTPATRTGSRSPTPSTAGGATGRSSSQGATRSWSSSPVSGPGSSSTG